MAGQNQCLYCRSDIKGISITTEGKKVVFGTLLTEEAKTFIAATLMQEVNYA